MDVQTAFLYKDLKEEVYIKLLASFYNKSLICKLRKSIYKLKQAFKV
jgi:hypothetical protein